MHGARSNRETSLNCNNKREENVCRSLLRIDDREVARRSSYPATSTPKMSGRVSRTRLDLLRENRAVSDGISGHSTNPFLSAVTVNDCTVQTEVVGCGMPNDVGESVMVSEFYYLIFVWFELV